MSPPPADSAADHPRAYGEHIPNSGTPFTLTGSPPPRSRAACAPRTRGGDPLAAHGQEVSDQCSPYARG